MRMIIGGAWQGQLDWAKKYYQEVCWIDGKTCFLDDIYTCEGIYDFHEYIKRIMMKEHEEKRELENLAKKLISENPDILIVSDEIGYGLVPVDAFERRYREQTGRICTELASFSKEVVRVVMGIGMVIKKDCITPGNLL